MSSFALVLKNPPPVDAIAMCPSREKRVHVPYECGPGRSLFPDPVAPHGSHEGGNSPPFDEFDNSTFLAMSSLAQRSPPVEAAAIWPSRGKCGHVPYDGGPWGIPGCHRHPWEKPFDVIPEPTWAVPNPQPQIGSGSQVLPLFSKIPRPWMPSPCARQGKNGCTSL